MPGLTSDTSTHWNATPDPYMSRQPDEMPIVTDAAAGLFFSQNEPSRYAFSSGPVASIRSESIRQKPTFWEGATSKLLLAS